MLKHLVHKYNLEKLFSVISGSLHV